MRAALTSLLSLLVLLAALMPAFAQGKDDDKGHDRGRTTPPATTAPASPTPSETPREGEPKRGGSPTPDHGKSGKGGEPRSGDHGRKSHEEKHVQRSEKRWEKESEERRDAAAKKAEKHGLFGRLAYDNATGIAQGRYVAFHLAGDTGAIHGVTTLHARNATPFFAAVTPSPFVPAGGPEVHGSALDLPGATVTLAAHDNPTSALHYYAHAPLELVFLLAEGATVSANTTREAQVRSGALHGHVATNGAPLAVEGRLIRLHLQPGEQAMFRAHPPSQDAAVLHGEVKAFKDGRLGASVRIAQADGVVLQDDAPVTVAVEAQEVVAGRATLNVSSEHPEGQVLFLTFDATTLDPRSTNISVVLSGEAAAPMADVASVVGSDTLAAFVQGSPDEGTLQVVLNIPHFSSYTLVVTDLQARERAPATQASVPQGVPAFMLLLFLGSLLTFSLLRRR